MSAKRAAGPMDFRVVVAPLALILLAYPAIVVMFPQLSDFLLVLVSILPAALVFIRLLDIAWPAIWLILLLLIYALSSLFGANQDRGYVHTITLACTATVFLTFAIYGSAILSYKWVWFMVVVIVLIDLVTVSLGSVNKNTEGGTLIYVISVACVAKLQRPDANPWRIAALFFGAGSIIALIIDHRGLVVYSLVFLIAFISASRMPKRSYWIAGIASSSAAVFATIWLYLNIDRGSLARRFAEVILEFSGRRIDNGREDLWLYILRATQENPIFGLGAGILPRDILSTDLSGHNYYLQVYLQVGILGLAILVAFLLSVWWILAKATTAAGRFGSAVFLMFVVENGVETLMFQNSTVVSVPAWIAIGMAIAIERNPEFVHRPALNAKTKLSRPGNAGGPGPWKRG